MNSQRDKLIESNSRSSRQRNRHGFTLAELLIVIAIILVMGTLVLAVMRSAQEDAREAATRSRIDMLETLLQTVLEDFEVRRLPISNAELAGHVGANPLGAVPAGVQLKNVRRRILADILRVEFPSWVKDVSGNYVPNPQLGYFPSNLQPFSLVATPSPFDQGFSDWLNSDSSASPYHGYPNPGSGNLPDRLANSFRSSEMDFWLSLHATDGSATRPEPRLNLPGEYLYIILSRIDVDGTAALDLLGSTAVGDPDGDQLPDVVDGWGESMELRVLQVAPLLNPADALNAAADSAFSQPANDIWKWQETNWAQLDPNTKLPVGYQVLNPIIPAPISKIRFQVVSPTLDAQNN